MDKPPSRIKTVRLPNDPFAQSNGYKPAPLDLTAITLSGKLEELIDQLAENTHNVWAKERISQAWTYGLNEVSKIYLNFLVREFIYNILDHRILITKGALISSHIQMLMT